MKHALNTFIELGVRYINRTSWNLMIPLFIAFLVVLYFIPRYRDTFSISGIVFFAFYFSFMISVTIVGRSNIIADYNIDILKTYKALFSGAYMFGLMEIVFNILLFVPLGIFLYKIQYYLKNAILILLTTSVAIEIIQYRFMIGTMELSDIVNNVLGGTLGYAIFFRLKGQPTFRKESS